MRILRWIIGAIILLGIVVLVIVHKFESVFYPYPANLQHVGFVGRAVYILILSALLLLYRILRGPTAADRTVAIDIFGVLVVGLCALLGVASGRNWYIDIGIAWALQSFIGTLALAKFLEGRRLDD
jgi:multicomponent Na+:H+ antiporter subunit F